MATIVTIFIIVHLLLAVELWRSIEPSDLPSLQSVYIGDRSFGGSDKFDIRDSISLSKIDIGDYCFSAVDKFILTDFSSLKDLKIGSHSFTKETNSYDNNVNRLFSIVDCANLCSITIGECSFSDYGGGFTLKNLPSLESVKIGVIETGSWNFYFSSFTMESSIYIESTNCRFTKAKDDFPG